MENVEGESSEEMIYDNRHEREAAGGKNLRRPALKQTANKAAAAALNTRRSRFSGGSTGGPGRTHTHTHTHRNTKTLVDSCQLAAKQVRGETMEA